MDKKTKKGGIGDTNLVECYSLGFKVITYNMRKYFADKYNKNQRDIAVIIDYRGICVLCNGKFVEVFNSKQVDTIFQSCDVRKLRKSLRRLSR